MSEQLRPAIVVGPSPGPTVAVLGGVHGDEYEGVIAALSLARTLAGELVAGQVRIAAPAHQAAWAAGTRRSPVDGIDLARVFPGHRDGGPTERVAHALTEQVIVGADLLIDLHSAGSDFEMPFLCGFQASDEHVRGDRLGARSQRFAEAFAARFTWRHDGAPAPGRSLTAAFELGVPAIYVEGHGGRSIRADDLSGYHDGVCRVLHLLGMLNESPAPSQTPVAVRGDGNTDAGIVAPSSGYLVARCAVGDLIRIGDTIATIVDLDGTCRSEILAPQTGSVMLLRREARVSAGDTVCLVAPGDGETCR